MFSPTTTFLRILETFHEEKRGKESYFRRVELREEMLIRTIGKRKFHEESFSSDFFFFFFLPTNRMIRSTPCPKLRPVSAEAIIKDNQFLLLSFHRNSSQRGMNGKLEIDKASNHAACRL